MNTIAIIPARMGSTRFPGKPMECIHGMPMIGHVYHRTRLAKNVDLTCVATCDQEIFDYITGIGGIAVMTSDQHDRASDRSAEALLKMEKERGVRFDIVAMIQGDEPLVQPGEIELAIEALVVDDSVSIVNLMGTIKTEAEFENPNEVKVVVDRQDNALYFSREPIPSRWKGRFDLPMRKQLGLIFFRRDYLLRFNRLDQTPLEIIESVDMMRVLENGDRVRMVSIDGETIGVDTKEDLAATVLLMNNDPLKERYLK